mmetsp:Transcript_4577/g.11784  ORF Transcript_4577/g.11784 Transcript_4577/m.11784 type:complete len:485 (+) Transcript_4577:203-1657(+)|eukprot:CAMPEP_0197190220 /NCGR_PEP_ID=MMETSP1423-20130617/21233_1 /TAXON_ID=476441 /ORGANISM="Pseudo-nitzschia heimii, Strain UNC1101" /LENGTH=484 /DNA_ID=CAMNT_0042642555 /DNA_START=179 /DNA_END=1633 /DNA_ORIENTATION=+
MPCCDRYPKLCCHIKYTEPTVADECRCGRGGTNGIVFVLLSQTFLIIGLCFATATIGDCSLVILDEPTVVKSDNTTATTLGFLSYRDVETDRCYWWSGDTETTGNTSAIAGDLNDTVIDANTTVYPIANDTNDIGKNEILFYLTEALGQDWRVSMGLCGAALSLGLVIFLYSASFYCSTQVRGFRVFLGALVGCVMPLLMGLGTVMVHQSEWCDIVGCSMGRSTIFGIVASVCFLLSGIFYCGMENWPGQKELDDMEKKRTWMKDPYKKKRSSPRKKSKDDSPRSRSNFNADNKYSNRSNRRTDHTGGTQYNDHTSQEIDEESSSDISASSFEELEKLPQRPSTPKGKKRSSQFKKSNEDRRHRSGSDRYSDELSPVRRSRPRRKSNLTSRDESWRSGTDESSSEMNIMNTTDSSTFLDLSKTVVHHSSSHIRNIEDVDSSRVALHGDSAHIRSIENLDSSRVAVHDDSAHIRSIENLDDSRIA